MSIVTLRSAETFWEREVRESLFWLVDGLVWGGWVWFWWRGGRRTVRVRRLRTWWVVGEVGVEVASECYGSCCCWDVVVDDAVVVVVVVVSHSQAKWMDV